MTQKVVLVGDSITRGQVSASYIGPLRRRFTPQEFQFINHGINNDTTYNVLRRIHHIEFITPQFIFVLIGTNDLLATRSDASAAFYILNKGLPQRPTFEWSIDNAHQIVRRLKSRTSAKIGLLSIPMLGEDLNSSENESVRIYNQSLEAIAHQEGVGFLPIYDRLTATLQGDNGEPLRTSTPLTAEFLARRVLYNEDFNTFSQRKGYRLLIDGVHLNRKGAEIVAAEIAAYLRSNR
jgi:lysophospholipase L1-like esterase